MIDLNYPNHASFDTPEYNQWQECYFDAQKLLSDKAKTPNLKGRPIYITVYKNVDHTHDILTQQLVTNILLFVNNTSVKAISKRQKTVETLTYGSKLVASKQAVKLIIKY